MKLPVRVQLKEDSAYPDRYQLVDADGVGILDNEPYDRQSVSLEDQHQIAAALNGFAELSQLVRAYQDLRNRRRDMLMSGCADGRDIESLDQQLDNIDKQMTHLTAKDPS